MRLQDRRHRAAREAAAGDRQGPVDDPRRWPTCGPGRGLTGVREVAERLRPRLRTHRDERGRELLDVPGAPLPDPATPAPPRFLPLYDNVLLGHEDRSRIIPAALRDRALSISAPPARAVLVDGFLAATWTLRRDGDHAALRVTPLRALTKRHVRALGAEPAPAGRLLAPDGGRSTSSTPPRCCTTSASSSSRTRFCSRTTTHRRGWQLINSRREVRAAGRRYSPVPGSSSYRPCRSRVGRALLLHRRRRRRRAARLSPPPVLACGRARPQPQLRAARRCGGAGALRGLGDRRGVPDRRLRRVRGHRVRSRSTLISVGEVVTRALVADPAIVLIASMPFS